MKPPVTLSLVPCFVCCRCMASFLPNQTTRQEIHLCFAYTVNPPSFSSVAVAHSGSGVRRVASDTTQCENRLEAYQRGVKA